MSTENYDILPCMQVLGEVVNIIQNVKGLKNSDIQKKSNVSSSQLSQIKAGKKLPSLDKLFQLSKGLDIPASVILRLVEEQQESKHNRIELMQRICEKINELECQEKAYNEELSRINESK